MSLGPHLGAELPDLVEDRLDLGVRRVEVRRQPDAAARAPVDEEPAAEELVVDALRSREVHAHHPAAALGIERRVDLQSLRAGEVDRLRDLALRLLPDRPDPDLADDGPARGA